MQISGVVDYIVSMVNHIFVVFPSRVDRWLIEKTCDFSQSCVLLNKRCLPDAAWSNDEPHGFIHGCI